MLFDRIVDLDRARDGVAWAATIAGYEVLTTRRAVQRRREEHGELVAHRVVAIADTAALPDERYAAHELADAVRAAVGELGPRDQEALAELLAGGTPARGETPRKRRFRAIERLRAAWRRRHG